MERKTSESAQGIVEYGLIVVLVLLAVLLILSMMGVSLRVAYCQVVTGLGFETSYCESAYCSDLFDEGLNGWAIPANGGWEVRDGQLCSNADGWNHYAYNTCSYQKPPSDYIINIDVATLFQGNGYGVFFRLQDYSANRPSGYAFQYDPGAGGAFVVRKWVNGYEINPPIVRKVIPGYGWYNQPRSIRIRAQGDIFTAYVDGEEVFSFTDSTYPEGGAGLRYWHNSRVCLDDFSILPLN